jgi:hypothetical protein
MFGGGSGCVGSIPEISWHGATHARAAKVTAVDRLRAHLEKMLNIVETKG